MLKKVIAIVVVLCLIFGINAIAENTSTVTDGSTTGAEQQIPPGERPQGGRGNRGVQPSSDMQGITPPNMPNGEPSPAEFTPPEGFTPPNGEFTPSQNTVNQYTQTATSLANDDVTTENQQAPKNSEESGQTQGENQQLAGQMPGGMGGFPGNMQNFNVQTQEEEPEGFLGFVKTYSTPIASVILLGLAFIFVVFYKRKNY